MIIKTKKIIAVLSCVIFLQACSQLKSELGLDRHSPDEFTVIKRAPLSLPPEYNLRPPSENGVIRSIDDTQETAKNTIFGEQKKVVKYGSGEEVILSKIGADNRQEDIRAILDKESGFTPVKDKSFVDKILEFEDTQEVVNAKEEKKRIEDTLKAGKDITEGEVKTTKKKQSVFDKIFK